MKEGPIVCPICGAMDPMTAPHGWNNPCPFVNGKPSAAQLEDMTPDKEKAGS